MFKYNNIINTILGVVLFAWLLGCKTTTIDSPRQLLEKESILLEEFIVAVDSGDHNPNHLGNRDYLASIAVDTTDNLSVENMSGYSYFEMVTGQGDKPVQGQEVGYRYLEYRILPDADDIPVAVLFGGNWGNMDALTFTVGESTSTLAQRGVPEGVAAAITNMRYRGKSTVIMPSTLVGYNDYVSRLYELELMYISPR